MTVTVKNFSIAVDSLERRKREGVLVIYFESLSAARAFHRGTALNQHDAASRSLLSISVGRGANLDLTGRLLRW
jgi:hypothetical protein